MQAGESEISSSHFRRREMCLRFSPKLHQLRALWSRRSKRTQRLLPKQKQRLLPPSSLLVQPSRGLTPSPRSRATTNKKPADGDRILQFKSAAFSIEGVGTLLVHNQEAGNFNFSRQKQSWCASSKNQLPSQEHIEPTKRMTTSA